VRPGLDDRQRRTVQAHIVAQIGLERVATEDRQQAVAGHAHHAPQAVLLAGTGGDQRLRTHPSLFGAAAYSKKRRPKMLLRAFDLQGMLMILFALAVMTVFWLALIAFLVRYVVFLLRMMDVLLPAKPDGKP